MRKPYRPILPSSLQPVIAEDTDERHPKRRRTVRVACDSCRAKKLSVSPLSIIVFTYCIVIDHGVDTISAMEGIQFVLAAAGRRPPATIDLQVQKRH
jgi:hypothetical protein